MIICIHVDNILIFGTSYDIVRVIKGFLFSKFDMKDKSEVNMILGVRIIRKNVV